MLKMGVTTVCGGNCGMQNQRLSQFKRMIERLGGAPVNYVMLVGYNQMRYLLGIGHNERISQSSSGRCWICCVRNWRQAPGHFLWHRIRPRHHL